MSKTPEVLLEATGRKMVEIRLGEACAKSKDPQMLGNELEWLKNQNKRI
jgi:hypothetical protein